MSAPDTPQALVLRAILRRLDGDDLVIDGEEWSTEEPVGDYPAGDLLLEGPPGREVRIRLAVEIVEGTFT